MPRLQHGEPITVQQLQQATAALAVGAADGPSLTFAVTAPVDLQRFDYAFPALQEDPANLIPETPATRAQLIALGASMRDSADDAPGDASIPAIYTYLGQFIDHDITLEALSGGMPSLFAPDLAPLPLETVRAVLKNSRTATLDLDSLYGLPAERDGDRMRIGDVTDLPQETIPFLRPPGKELANDLRRLPPAPGSHEHDRAAIIGDPRNDENTLISQLHLAFLKAHNALIDKQMSFEDAKRTLRQHYQHIVLHDFLARLLGEARVQQMIAAGPTFFDGLAEPFFMPLEFAVAAFRFGHSMVRAQYDFNLNFNRQGGGAIPATLGLLFTFSALSGPLGGSETLPENWIVEWPNLIDGGPSKARRLDTTLVEPLFHLPDSMGQEMAGDEARLAVRNLLRGYMLRIPTGQAVAQALGIAPLTPAELTAVATAVSDDQKNALTADLAERTPLWYYILAEASHHHSGEMLGPVGGALVGGVLIELVRRSEDSILRTQGWTPTLPVRPGGDPAKFILADLLALARVL